ncbi:hypothetical protein HMI55_003078 [Coelomomyces lativittatus]|nr:hypothetical protein HMI55_003078 [Coelomomyces lativittatus]
MHYPSVSSASSSSSSSSSSSTPPPPPSASSSHPISLSTHGAMTLPPTTSSMATGDGPHPWNHYVEIFATPSKSKSRLPPRSVTVLDDAGHPITIRYPYLKRNLKRPHAISLQTNETIYSKSALHLKMCVNTYRLFYLANTEDIFIRFQVGHPSSISTSTSTSTSTPTPTSTPWMKDGATWLPDFYQALMKKSIFTKKSKANASSSYYASMPFSSTNSIMTLVHATTPPTTKNIPSPNSLTPTEFKENEKETEKEKENDIESEKEKEMKLATDTATEIKKETEKEMNHVHEDFKKTEIEIKKEPDDDPAHPDLTFTLPSSSTMSATSSSSSAPYIHTVPLPPSV